MGHAFLSASGAPSWIRCHAKPWREKGLPDQTSRYAEEGTAAHALLESCLVNNNVPSDYLGEILNGFTVDTEMARYVQETLDIVDGLPGEVYPEQALPIAFITGEEGAEGTADVTIVNGNVLTIIDLKYGRGIQVFAEGNEQLLMYAAAAVEEFDLAGDVDQVTMIISQPRMGHTDTVTMGRKELDEKVAYLRQAAVTILANDNLQATPGDKQCQFCKAKATCEENRQVVLESIGLDFEDLTKGETLVTMQDAERLIANAYGVDTKAVDFIEGGFVVAKPSILPKLQDIQSAVSDAEDEKLATLMDAVGMIEGLCKSVRAEVEKRLLSGVFTDQRYKLVAGKKGARAWTDEKGAEEAIKAMRLKKEDMYNNVLKSPAQLEKVLSDNPRRWTKLQDFITQTGGKPSVAPASDKRPAYQLLGSSDFEPISD